MLRIENRAKTTYFLKVFLLLIITTIASISLWWFLSFYYRPLYNLPEYPNATITSDYNISGFKQYKIICWDQFFTEEKYQVLLTSDTTFKVNSFYQALPGVSHAIGNYTLNGAPPTLCYKIENSAITITTLDPNLPEDAKFITQLFPQNTPNKSIIIAEVGYLDHGE